MFKTNFPGHNKTLMKPEDPKIIVKRVYGPAWHGVGSSGFADRVSNEWPGAQDTVAKSSTESLQSRYKHTFRSAVVVRF